MFIFFQKGDQGSVKLVFESDKDIHIAPIYSPRYAQHLLLLWLSGGSYIASKLMNITSIGRLLTIAYAVLTIFTLNYAIMFSLRFVYCIFFCA